AKLTLRPRPSTLETPLFRHGDNRRRPQPDRTRRAYPEDRVRTVLWRRAFAASHGYTVARGYARPTVCGARGTAQLRAAIPLQYPDANLCKISGSVAKKADAEGRGRELETFRSRGEGNRGPARARREPPSKSRERRTAGSRGPAFRCPCCGYSRGRGNGASKSGTRRGGVRTVVVRPRARKSQ